MPLTQEQINQIRQAAGAKPVSTVTNPQKSLTDRLGIKTEPTVLGSLKESFKTAKDQITGSGEFKDEIAPQRGVELAATITGAIPKAIGAAIPEKVKEGVMNAPLTPIPGSPSMKDITSGVGSGLSWLADKIGGIEAVQKFVTEHPEAAKSLENFAKTTGALAETAGNELMIEGGVKAAPVVKDLAVTGGKKIVEGTSKLIEKIHPTPTIDELVGRVAQGKKGDIPSFSRGLQSLETSDIKTYADLSKRSQETIKKLVDEQDALLDKDPTPRRMQQLALEEEANGKTIAHNYVKDAVDQLEELYSKTNDPVNLAKIQYIKERLDPIKGTGLTVKEVNAIARQYGSEFGKKAFSKTGDPLTSINAQAFENTRMGVKETARNLLPDDASRALDAKMTDIYKVDDLASKMEGKVNTLVQKMSKPTVLQKVAKGIGQGIDTLTGGSIRVLAQKLLGLSGETATLNAVEIEAALAKNLKKIDALMNGPEENFVQGIIRAYKEMPPSVKQGGYIKTGLKDKGTIPQIDNTSTVTSTGKPAKRISPKITLYHGTTMETADKILKGQLGEGFPTTGLSLSVDKAVSDGFARNGKVIEMSLTPNAKVMPKSEVKAFYDSLIDKSYLNRIKKEYGKYSQEYFDAYADEFGTEMIHSAPKLAKYAKENGYDAVDLRGSADFGFTEDEIKVVNPKAVIIKGPSIK